MKKNKFATTQVKIFLVTSISGNKSIFLFGLRAIKQALMDQNLWHTWSYSENVFNNVVDMFVKAGIGDVEQNIDRAHWTGKTYAYRKSKKKRKNIIVKFT